MQRLYNMPIKYPFPNQKQSQKNKILKDTVFILITENHLTQKDQFHHLQKETHL